MIKYNNDNYALVSTVILTIVSYYFIRDVRLILLLIIAYYPINENTFKEQFSVSGDRKKPFGCPKLKNF